MVVSYCTICYNQTTLKSIRSIMIFPMKKTKLTDTAQTPIPIIMFSWIEVQKIGQINRNPTCYGFPKSWSQPHIIHFHKIPHYKTIDFVFFLHPAPSLLPQAAQPSRSPHRRRSPSACALAARLRGSPVNCSWRRYMIHIVLYSKISRYT